MTTLRFLSNVRHFQRDIDNIKQLMDGWGRIALVEAYKSDFSENQLYLIRVEVTNKTQFNKMKLSNDPVYRFFMDWNHRADTLTENYHFTLIHTVPEDQYSVQNNHLL